LAVVASKYCGFFEDDNGLTAVRAELLEVRAGKPESVRIALLRELD
jgi:hypothetical protein